MAAYKSLSPPVIDLTNITDVPVAHFIGLEDPLCFFVDASWVKDQIPSSIYYREFADYDHNSFVSGKEMEYTRDLLQLLSAH